MIRKLLLGLLLACVAPWAFATAPTLVASNVSAGTFNNTNQTITLSITSGDKIYLEVGSDTDPSTYTYADNQTIPGTYTLLLGQYSSGGGVGGAVYVASATQTGSITITGNKAGATTVMVMAAADVRGASTTTPDGTYVFTNSSIGTTTLSAMTMSPTLIATDLLLQFLVVSNAGVTVNSPVAGFTNQASMTGASADGSIAAAAQTTSSTGTFSAGWTAMTNASSRFYYAFALAIAGSGGGSCTHVGYSSSGASQNPNGTTGNYWGPAGHYVTPDCATIQYWQPSTGKFAVN